MAVSAAGAAISPMTPSELSAALDAIGWTDAELSRRLGTSKNFIREMRHEIRPIPAWVADFVARIRHAIVTAGGPNRKVIHRKQHDAE
jgi:hypothetical protein